MRIFKHQTWYLSAIFALATATRFLIIVRVPWANTSDLDNYFWAAQKVVDQQDPYRLWSQQLSGPRSDLMPLELALLSFIVYMGRSANAIRLFFVLCDLACLGLLAHLYRNDRVHQMLWLTLYGFGPATLYMFTLTPSDKPLLFALILLALIKASSTNNTWRLGTGCALGLLAALKWIGITMALPMFWADGRRNLRDLIRLSASAAAIFMASHGLWFPTWQVVYEYRTRRLAAQPFHTGIAVVLQSMGLPMPSLYLWLIAASCIVILGLWALKWLTWQQTSAMLFWASVYWMPDATPQMLWFTAMILLLTVSWLSWLRAALVWTAMVIVTLVFAASVYPIVGGPFNLEWAQSFAGVYGSVGNTLISQLLVWVCLAWIAMDALAGARRRKTGTLASS